MRTLLALTLTLAMTVCCVADEKPAKKGKNKAGRTNPMVQKLMGELEKAGLSDEQMGKIKAAAAEFQTSVAALRKEGLTPELNKKRGAAMKEAREAGLKGKEVAEKVNAALTEDEQALLAKMQAATVKMKKAVAAALTKEQLEALPEAARKQLATGNNRGKGQGKGKGGKKNKKEAAAS